MDTTERQGRGTRDGERRAQAGERPAAVATADRSAPGIDETDAWMPPAAASLSRSATDVLSAVEDCVDEIRFHQDALMRALQRRTRMAETLGRLITDLRRQAGARSPSRPASPASETACTGMPAVSESAHRLAGTAAAPDTPHQLTVYALGQTRILQDGQPIDDWPSSKGKAAFKYLLLQRRQPVAKERLIALFWPDADPEGARNNLNVTIYGIRKVLGHAQPDVAHIVLEDGCYRLNADLDLWVDLEAFDERLRAGRTLESQGQVDAAIAAYREAEQLYQGDLFAEERAEDWCLPERQRLRESALDLLRRLARLSLAQEDPHAAVAAHRRLLGIDPCDEQSHRELMRLYARLDRPQLAVRQFRSCAEALSRELHMIPSPETTALYRRIQRREAP